MRKTLTLLLLAILILPACEKQRVDDLEERLVRLETRVDELEQRSQKAPAEAAGEDATRRLEALRKIKDLAVKLSEHTYKKDDSLPAGMGAADILILPRDDAEQLRRNYFLALQDINAKDIKPLAGVSVKIGGKSYGTTPAKGPLRIEGLEPGEYEAQLSYGGLEPRSYPFEVREGQVKEIVTFLLNPGEAAEQLQQLLERRQQQKEPHQQQKEPKEN